MDMAAPHQETASIYTETLLIFGERTLARCVKCNLGERLTASGQHKLKDPNETRDIWPVQHRRMQVEREAAALAKTILFGTTLDCGSSAAVPEKVVAAHHLSMTGGRPADLNSLHISSL
jgi:hypothetical protein